MKLLWIPFEPIFMSKHYMASFFHCQNDFPLLRNQNWKKNVKSQSAKIRNWRNFSFRKNHTSEKMSPHCKTTRYPLCMYYIPWVETLRADRERRRRRPSRPCFLVSTTATRRAAAAPGASRLGCVAVPKTTEPLPDSYVLHSSCQPSLPASRGWLK